MPRLFLILLLSCLLTPAAPARAAAPGAKPNFLFFFADDWGRFASAYAKLDGPGTVNDVIHTPNFDKLAAEGILVRNAFVSAPSCTPCRSALFSGQHFWRTGRGSILQGAIWDFTNPSFPLLLKDAGYHIGVTYKGWSPGTPNNAVFGNPPANYTSAGGEMNQFSQTVTANVKKGVPLEDAKQAIYKQVLGNFNAFLADRKPGQPFLYYFGPTNTHRKWIKGSGLKLWNINPDDLKGKMVPFLPDVPEVREDMADYFGEAQALDGALAVLLKRLEETGEADNTIVIVSGDHGMPGVTHGKCNLYDFGIRVSLAIRWPSGAQGGRVIDDLVSLTDLAPTILEAAGVEIPKVMTGKSLVPILKSGRSGLVENRTQVFAGRERHVENANEDYLPYPQRAIRTPDYLYIINFHPERWPMGVPYLIDDDNAPDPTSTTEDTRITLRDMDGSPTKTWLITHRKEPTWKRYYDMAFARRPREELYILADDPHQVRNVAQEPMYQKLREEMEGRLMAELVRTGDPRVIDNGKFFETPPMAGPIKEGPDSEKAKKVKGAKKVKKKQ